MIRVLSQLSPEIATISIAVPYQKYFLLCKIFSLSTIIWFLSALFLRLIPRETNLSMVLVARRMVNDRGVKEYGMSVGVIIIELILVFIL